MRSSSQVKEPLKRSLEVATSPESVVPGTGLFAVLLDNLTISGWDKFADGWKEIDLLSEESSTGYLAIADSRKQIVVIK